MFNPSGTRLATASADGNVRVYILLLDELMAAGSRLTRSWTATDAERRIGGAVPAREGDAPSTPLPLAQEQSCLPHCHVR